jgi:hypothetical protein
MVHSTGKSGVYFDLTVVVDGLDDNGRKHIGDRHAEQNGKRRSDYRFFDPLRQIT